MKSCAALVMLLVSALISAGARADTAGEKLLEKCVDAEAKLKSLQANFTMRQEMGAQTRVLHGAMKLKKPNRALITIQGAQESDSRTLASDGNKFTTYYSADNEFTKEASDPSGGNIGRSANTEATIFFNSDVLNQIRAQGTGIKVTGSVTIGGVACKELSMTGGAPNSIYKLYVGSDGLLRGVTLAYDTLGGRFLTDGRLSEVKSNPSLPDSAFAFALPKGAKSYQDKVADTRPSSGTDPADSGLLPIGANAPDFTLPQPEGGKLSFRSVFKANKATLLCFWNNTFLPCREELPDLNKMLTEYRNRGFDIVTINSGDSAATIQKLWKDNNLTLRAVMNGDKVADRYHVTAVPTNYLIGGNGKILARFEGFDETAIRAALPKAGVK